MSKLISAHEGKKVEKWNSQIIAVVGAESGIASDDASGRQSATSAYHFKKAAQTLE